MLAPPDLSLLLIMVCFWAVYWLVSSQLVRPLGALLDERARRAEEARRVLTGAQTALYETVAWYEEQLAAVTTEEQRHRTALRSEGEAARRARLEAAREAGQQRLTQLSEELQGAGEMARRQLQEQAPTLARELAERVLGRKAAS